MGMMTTPKPLINIIWTCQEMMVWMGMELIGSVALGQGSGAAPMGMRNIIILADNAYISASVMEST
jgi:hypothetical protein